MNTTLTRFESDQYIFLDHITWPTYEALLREAGERHLRFTYDNGNLEVMTLSLGHESTGELLGLMIRLLAMELHISVKSGGSTTLKRRMLKKGLEPDKCYWIANEPRMRGKKQFKPKTDPPPDLAIEIDVTHGCLDRLQIYAALKLPEIWRHDGTELLVYWLIRGEYRKKKCSLAFPFLPMNQVAEFLRRSQDEDETIVIRDFLAWVQSDTLPKHAQ